jgi:hypothetical protein
MEEAEDEEQAFESSKCKELEGGCVGLEEVLTAKEQEVEEVGDEEQVGVPEDVAVDRELRKPVLGYRRSVTSGFHRALAFSESEEEIAISDGLEKLLANRIYIREQRRALHNVLERKRRNDLKDSFQVLRGQIPELKDNQRAPRVTILRKAAEYIKQIREEDEDLQTRMAKEKRRETRLLQHLAYLESLA